jgi:hypothetical protein
MGLAAFQWTNQIIKNVAEPGAGNSSKALPKGPFK